MTDNNISVSVPKDDKRAQIAAAMMFLTVAGELDLPDLDDVSTQTRATGGFDPTVTRVTADGEDITGADQTGQDHEHRGTDTAGPTTAPNASEDTTAPELPDTPATTAPAPGAETDAAGMPWDSRIHASTKTKTKDGHWKKRKGVDDATRQAVEAELKNLMAIPSPGTSAPETTAPEAPAAATPAPPAPEAPAAVAPPPAAPEAPAAATPAPPPAPEAPAQDDMDFATFLKEVAHRVQNGHITMERVNEIVVGEGIQSISMLSNRPDLVPGIWQQIQMLIGENQ